MIEEEEGEEWTNMFCGLRSRWTKPWLVITTRAEISDLRIAIVVEIGRGEGLVARKVLRSGTR